MGSDEQAGREPSDDDFGNDQVAAEQQPSKEEHQARLDVAANERRHALTVARCDGVQGPRCGARLPHRRDGMRDNHVNSLAAGLAARLHFNTAHERVALLPGRAVHGIAVAGFRCRSGGGGGLSGHRRR